MTPGIYKNGKLIRTLTEDDFNYRSFTYLLKSNEIKETGLTVICPKCENVDESYSKFFNSNSNIKEIDMHLSEIMFECSYCNQIEKAILPDHLSEYDICSNLMETCELKEINISENNPHYASVDGVLYNKKKTKLIHYPAKSEAKLDENLKVVDAFAFYDFEGDVIKLPHGVETLITQSFMFKNIQKEIKVFLPETIKEISSSFISSETPIKFYYCTQSVKDRIDKIKNGFKETLADDIDIKCEPMTLDSLLASEPNLTMTEINDILSGTDICR